MARIGVWVAIVGALAVLGLAPPADASSGNESLANATDLNVANSAIPSSDFGFFSGTPSEPGEPNHAGQPTTDSVWGKWTAPIAETLTASLCNAGNQYDSVLEIYEGPATGPTFTNISSVAADDNGCGGTSDQSQVKFRTVAGKTYYIVIGKVGFTGGITWEIEFRAAPANDDFSGDVLPTTTIVTTTGSNVGATKEPGEPDHAGSPAGASVWWSWTAPTSGPYAIATCGSSFNTVLAVYTGGAFTGGLTPIASNDDACVNNSKVALTTTQGVTYRIAVDGGPGLGGVADTGNIALSIAPRPANDDLAAAAPFGAFPLLVNANNLAATSEVNENAHDGITATNSIWYRWTSPTSAPVTVDACSSTLSAHVGVYDDGNTFPLTPVTSTAAGACGRRFTPAAGSAYMIAVDGAGGDVTLAIHDVTEPTTTLNTTALNKRRHKATFTFTGSDDRPGTLTFMCKLDTRPFADCSTLTVTYTRLRRGSHIFKVKAIDVAGNEDTSPATKTFRFRR